MEENNIIVLTDEEGNEINFEHLATLSVEDTEYAILIPEDQNDEEEQEFVIMRIVIEDEEMILEYIEDDDELNTVYEAFIELAEENFEIEED